MIKIYRYGEVSNEEIFARDNIAPNVADVVREIIATVAREGDAALYAYAKKFDRAELSSLEVTEREIDEAFATVEPRFVDILREAAANIRAFHEKQLRTGFSIDRLSENGTVVGQKITPIEKVGLYVPGGTAAYPSTVLMDAIRREDQPRHPRRRQDRRRHAHLQGRWRTGSRRPRLRYRNAPACR